MRISARAARAAPRPVASPPALFVTCGDLILGLDSARIVRLVLADEVEVVIAPGTGDAPHAGAIDLGDGRVPAWDLGALLCGGAESSAWVVAWFNRIGGERRFALRTGTCVCVRPMPTCVPLPPRLMLGRASALSGAFRTDGISELHGRPCGYALAPERLLGAAELAAAADLARRGVVVW